MNKGSIIQVMGPVVDISFKGSELPALYNAINLKSPQDDNETIVCEVAQHLGDDAVRTVSMHSTDGLVRGQEAIDPVVLSRCRWVKTYWDVSQCRW